MGPQQGQSGHDARVEAIDLTLSSPEPEARPEPRVSRYMQQQQPTRIFEEEPERLRTSTHGNNDLDHRQGPTRSGNVPQQELRVNPQHIKRIIDTSSHRALRNVVLQLCKTSPALSGALVRGLAPHSPWAQTLVRGQQAKSQTQTQHAIKMETRANDYDAYERLKRRVGPSGASQSSASQIRTNRPPAIHENRDSLRLPPSSQKAPTVKREHRPSPTDSDDSTNIVDFPTVEEDARRQEPNRHATSHSSYRHHLSADHTTERLAALQHSTQYDVYDHKQKLCSQCGELYEEGDVNCYFHTGHEGPARPGDIPQFTCCNKFVGEPGCKVGRHISEKTGTLTNTKRPSPAPRNGSQWSKKPRVL